MEAVGRSKDGHGLLRVYIQPRASRNQLCGLHGDAVKLAITAPPVDGKANKAIILFLAKLFKVGKTDITLAAGSRARTKTFMFASLTEQELGEKLTALLTVR